MVLYILRLQYKFRFSFWYKILCVLLYSTGLLEYRIVLSSITRSTGIWLYRRISSIELQTVVPGTVFIDWFLCDGLFLGLVGAGHKYAYYIMACWSSNSSCYNWVQFMYQMNLGGQLLHSKTTDYYIWKWWTIKWRVQVQIIEYRVHNLWCSVLQYWSTLLCTIPLLPVAQYKYNVTQCKIKASSFYVYSYTTISKQNIHSKPYITTW